MKKIALNDKPPDEATIKEVVLTLRKGGVVALPTETVYGLAAVFTNAKAVERLYQIKKRAQDKSLTACVADTYSALELFSIMPPFGYRMIEKFWPGPLTIVYHGNASEHTLGVRVCDHEATRIILKNLGDAVVLSSANVSGQKEAFTADEVERAFGDEVDLIVDGGPAKFSRASTVADLTFHPFKVLREGVIPLESLIQVFFKKRIVFVCTGNTCRSPMAEYILKSIFEQKYPFLKERFEVLSRGVISLQGQPANPHVEQILKEHEDISSAEHRSKRISRYTILSSDLIFVMEEAHREHILRLEPTAENRVFGLKKFLPPDMEHDIPDPIGQSLDVYEHAYSLIKDAVTELIDWLS